MNTDTPTIPAETANHVLAMFGYGGYPPGRWGQQLLELIAGADIENAALLAQAFPAEVQAVQIAKYDKGGIAQLQAIAGNVA
ncbi:hypothetical protein [Streptomyces sp. NPDC127040]|uniref:hypothetical protein n=1 Tax=Streptomyces sp. NPDC127040 TaxID=3347116 RepID=UPI0036678337